MRCRFLVVFSCFVVLTRLGAVAQRGQDIFVTPIANAPFTGTVQVQRTMIQSDGKVVNVRTTRIIARDSQGRIHNEAREWVLATSAEMPPVMSIHLYDPQTRVSTMVYPQQKLFSAGMVNRPPETVPPSQLYASPAGNSLPLSQFTQEKDLGTHRLDGLPVHGVRETQTIPASQSGTGKTVVITDEYWYSDDLRINMVMKHDDPRTGSMTMTVTQVSQDEPDPGLFQIPEGFKEMGVR